MIWLKFYGLARINVLDYFYTSPFFDITSNNQLIRTQGVRPEHLLNMTGIEYMLDELNISEPNLFVIKMQLRKSPREAVLLDIFYCLDGIIYQAPDMLDLVRSRILKTSHYLRNSFELLHGTAEYTSENGHLCWSNIVNTNDTVNISHNSNNDMNYDVSEDNIDNLLDNKKNDETATMNIREFPSFSRLIDDLRSSY
jgi:mediator of RNA polymerase II transcription subunit 6